MKLDSGQYLEHCGLHLKQGEAESNALPGTHTKRHIRVCLLGIPVLWGEPIGIKFLRIRPQRRVAVEYIGRHKHVYVLWNCDAIYGAGLVASSVDQIPGCIEP